MVNALTEANNCKRKKKHWKPFFCSITTPRQFQKGIKHLSILVFSCIFIKCFESIRRLVNRCWDENLIVRHKLKRCSHNHKHYSGHVEEKKKYYLFAMSQREFNFATATTCKMKTMLNKLKVLIANLRYVYVFFFSTRFFFLSLSLVTT